jgi:hypothetical protein
MLPPLEDLVAADAFARGCSHPTQTCTAAPDSAGRLRQVVGRPPSVAAVGLIDRWFEEQWIMDSESVCVQEKHRVKARSS